MRRCPTERLSPYQLETYAHRALARCKSGPSPDPEINVERRKSIYYYLRRAQHLLDFLYRAGAETREEIALSRLIDELNARNEEMPPTAVEAVLIERRIKTEQVASAEAYQRRWAAAQRLTRP